jgi:tRNA G18 (ribose-2'-O)-methylase SpoU
MMTLQQEPYSTNKNSKNNNSNGGGTSSITIISSTKSNTVKQFQTLLKKSSARMEQRQTIVEGPRITTELFHNSKTRSLLRHVLISDDYQGEYPELEGTKSTTRIVNGKSDNPHYQLSYVTPQVMKACTDTVTPQGIAALVDIPPSFLSLTLDHDPPTSPTPISQTTRLNENDRHSPYKYPLYLVLDGVSDPGNVGTLLRSSLAVGVAGIILLPECCDVWNPKAIRSAMGSTFYLPQILQVPSWDAAVSWLRDEAHVQHIYAATMLDDDNENDDKSNPRPPKKNQAHFDVDWRAMAPCALVIGSEGQGLNQDIRTALVLSKTTTGGSDPAKIQFQAVHVPMVANSIESLNAAVCGSVILFDYLRQTKNASS